MRVRLVVFGTLGFLSTGIGLTIFFAPELAISVRIVETLVQVFEQTNKTRPLVFVALGIIVYTVLSSASLGEAVQTGGSTVADQYVDATDDRPESVTTDKRALTARELDDKLLTAATEGGERFRSVRETLVNTAVAVRANATELDSDRAREEIRRGEWTDDRVVAAFLSGADGPTPPLLSRFRLWLVPVRERRRRIERSLAAIEEMQP